MDLHKIREWLWLWLFLDQYHKDGNHFLNHTVWVTAMKPRFHLLMLKQMSSQSSGCTQIHHTSWKSLNKHCLPARKLMVTIFWDWKDVLMVEFMQQGTIITSEVYCKTPKELRRAGHSEQKAWNADIQCGVPPWQCAYTYRCLYSSTAGVCQLSVVWPPSLLPWSHSKRLLPVYIPEELTGITALQQ
jgi:hypothetical protein